MRILMMSKYFPPEIGTASHLFHEMALQLRDRGHQVSVATTLPWYNLEDTPDRYRRRVFVREELDGLTVFRMASPWLPKGALRLAGGHVTVPPSIVAAGALAGRHDLVYVYSPPLLMSLGVWLAKLWRAPLVLGVQDLIPQAYVDLGVIRDPFSLAFFRGAEKFAYTVADKITVHSEGNREFIVNRRGVRPGKVVSVPNWVDTDALRPMPRDNDFAREHGLTEHPFIVSYAGTFGLSQGSMVVIDAARILANQPHIHFLLVGGGVDFEPMRARVDELGLTNVTMLPMQPKSVYPSILAASDVSLSLLKGEVRTPVVPSKILSIMAAERVVLASMPLDGDAVRLIDDAQCGLTVAPDDATALADAVRSLADDPQRSRAMAQRGRRYAVENLSLDVCAQRLEDVFTSALAYRREPRRVRYGYRVS